MNITQLTHHDLDGYGASTVAASFADIARCVHVPRYADVGPAFEEATRRMAGAAEPAMLLVTDLGLEPGTVKLLGTFAAANRGREEARRHRLVVLDHHSSSLDRMREAGLSPVADAADGAPKRFDLGDPSSITILIDETRSATRLAYDHRALYARDPELPGPETLQALVAAIDAVDLWRKERPEFGGGRALDEMFWDNVATLVPVGHEWHDRFVSALLLEGAALIATGATPAAVEREVVAARTRILDTLLADDPADDPGLTSRMRIVPALARSRDLFTRLSDGTLLSFALDAGTFQRVSDRIMDEGGATRVANVQRMGSMSFRSNDETALDGARKFRGGGHKDAAGGKLPSGSAFSLADAAAQVEPILNPPPPDYSKSPFAKLQALKG